MQQENSLYNAHVAFPISDDLKEEAMVILSAIKDDGDKKRHVADLIRIVEEVSSVGLQYYFQYPLQLAGCNIVTQKAVEVAVKTGQKAVLAVASGIVKSMSDAQVQVIASFIEQVIFEFGSEASDEKEEYPDEVDIGGEEN